MIAVELVIKILVSMITGFILYKMKFLNDAINAALSRIVVEIFCPFMILANIMSISGLGLVPKADVYEVLLIGIIIYVVLVPLSLLLVKILKTPQRASGTIQCLMIFGNVGFIGLPVAESLYGPIGVFYMALLNIHFNILYYSYGLWLVTRDVNTKFKFSWKRIINPAIISILAALILFLLDVKIPEIVISPISFVGSITAPLSMVVLGASIAAHELKKIFGQWRLYVLTAIRMILFPLVTYLIMKAVYGPGTITSIITFYLGTPAAVVTSMFAMAYGGDSETATSGTAMMNTFCIITIPGIYLLTTL